MTKTVVVTQPNYLPWLGYFEQLARADEFVFLDTVARSKNHWDNRNRLRTRDGDTYWLTLPLAAAPLDTPIEEIRLARDAPRWRRKHHRSVRQSLAGAARFDDLDPILAEIERIEATRLADLNIAIVEVLADALGITTPCHRASDLAPQGERTERLVDICRRFESSTYYTSAGAADYLESERAPFDAAGIDIIYQRFEHPVYPQVGDGFVSHLSVLDAIANIGLAATSDLLGPSWAVAGSRSWCREVFDRRFAGAAGCAGYASTPDELAALVDQQGVERVFFLHWSWKVPSEIVDAVTCVNFHMTDLPYGRGGSPLQNLIVDGHTETVVTAFVMDDGLDTGPILAKRPLTLEGRAEEIYRRAVDVSCDLIEELLETEPEPVPQAGEATLFRRRRPAQSRLPAGVPLDRIHDHIRMLDAEGYPAAFVEVDGLRIEFRNAALRDGQIDADVIITPADNAETEDGS